MKTTAKFSSFVKTRLPKKPVLSILAVGSIISILAFLPVNKKTENKATRLNNQASEKRIELQKSLVINNNKYATLSLLPEEQDKTLSPYFIVLSNDSSVDQLPLKSTSADVHIAGVIADVEITQVYKNMGKKTLEAIYTFPASTRAAIYSMEMIIGKRKIVATIKEKQQARQEYVEAKENGNRASLLEQDRPNVFQMNVANIASGDEIKIKMKYTELLVPESGTYKFVYPTVVGPRYTRKPDGSTSSNDDFVDSPYSKSGTEPTYNFHLGANISAGMPIQDVACKSHKINVSYPEQTTANIQLDSTEKRGGTRDFILEYKLAGGKIETGMLLYDHGDEKFFLMMLQPPKQIQSEDIPPREYVFIMDGSGSMNGYPMDISKKLLRNLITNLRPIDKFNVIVFSNDAELLSPTSLSANLDNIDKAMVYIDSKTGACGTEILPALKTAFALPRTTESLSRSFVILTDGYVDVEKESFSLIRNNLNKANFFAFGIGSSVNNYLIEGMAHAGGGEATIVTKEEYADAQCEKFRRYISSPVLTEIKRDFGKFEAYDIEPLSNPDILAERPVIIFGKYKGEPKGIITINGYTGFKKYTTSFDVSTAIPSNNNSAIRYLWAREKIKFLDDYSEYEEDSVNVKEVTRLGLKYNLLTAYTSFIAVDKTEVVDAHGKITTVQQTLPLPENVSNYAVGADFGIDDETAEYNSDKFSVYREIVLYSTSTEINDKIVIANVENKINESINNALLSLDLMGCDSITVFIDKNGIVEKVSVCGEAVSVNSRYEIEKLFLRYDFSFLGINKDWGFIIKF